MVGIENIVHGTVLTINHLTRYVRISCIEPFTIGS